MKKYLLHTFLLVALIRADAMPPGGIVINEVYGASYCTGSPLTVNFVALGVFQTGNYFTIQLSDASGSFATPDSIGSMVSSGSNVTITGTIPLGTPSGTAYRVRIVSSNPVKTSGYDNGENLVIQSPQPPALGVSGTGCQGIDSLSLIGSGSIYQINWYMNNAPIDSFTSSSYLYSVVAGGHGHGDTANQLYEPNDVSIDTAGNIFVDDFGNDRIQKWAPGADSGITVAGGNGYGASAIQLAEPGAVFVDHNGYIYVSDYGNNRIQQFPPDSRSDTSGVTVAGSNGTGTGLNQVNRPIGIFVDGTANFYAVDYTYDRIMQFYNRSTSLSDANIIAGGNGAGIAADQLSDPEGVYLDANGNSFVLDVGNNRIQEFPANSIMTTNGTTVAGSSSSSGSAANQLNLPTGVYGDAFGRTYVSDLGNARIQRFPAGSDSTTNAVTITQSGQVSQPKGLCLDANGNVYVADQHLNNVVKYSPVPPAASYMPTTAGSYSATYSTWSGCVSPMSNADTIQVCSGIIPIAEQNNISLYPNPNCGSFILQSSDAIGKEYIITDMLGRVVAEQTISSNNQNIELQNISEGSYMLSVKGSNSKALRFAVE